MGSGKPKHPETSKSLNQVLLDRRDAPAKDADEVAAQYIYDIARKFLKRETAKGRHERILRDFKNAATRVYAAAKSGKTVGEQRMILQKLCAEFELPESDHRKDKEKRGPTDARLRKEYDQLRAQLVPVLPLSRRKDEVNQSAIIKEVRALVRHATPNAARTAARCAPAQAAKVLLGSRYAISPGTVNNRIFPKTEKRSKRSKSKRIS